MPIIQDYITHGWSLVPIISGSKVPKHPGWNTRVQALPSEDDLPHGYGVGLAHAYSGTMALDIDDWDGTLALGIDLELLCNAPDSVTILSGKPGHGKLLYQMPFGLTLPSKQIREGKVVICEFRCATADGKTVQDVLPPSIHPDTKLPYQWGGNGHWSRLPMLPTALLDYWVATLKDVPTVTVGGVDASWDEIKDALAHIDPDCTREDWVQVGMALKWSGEQTFNPDQAFALWDEWSSVGSKYRGQRETVQQWRSFRSEKGTVVTLGTLFHLAAQNGWKRATPDASGLFGDVSAMAQPEDILTTLKPKPPDIDLGLWPTVLARRAQEVSDSVGCDPVVPLWAGLAAVCGVVDARTRLELMPGFKVPPVLWLMTIGDPGDRKTPGSAPMLDPLNDIELADKPRYASALSVWKYQQAVYVGAFDAMTKYAKSPDGVLDPSQAPLVPAEPAQPVPLKITVDDITSQELVKKCQQRPRGVLCHLDEMNAWVQKLTNRMSGENRSAWVRGFESKRYEMDRVHNGSTYCENFALSIYGNMQPQVLDDNFTSMASDGLLQRFVPVVLRHNQSRISKPVPDFMTSAGTWANLLASRYALEPTTYRLTPEAYALFREFQHWYEDRMKSERLAQSSNEFVTAFGKITGLVGRLALVFHIIESPHKAAISADVMERVIRIAREFVIPTFRYVFDRDGAASAFDAWMLEYVIQHADLERVTLSDIKGSARRRFDKSGAKTNWGQNELVINAMYMLEQMKWVVRVDDNAKLTQGIATWAINPHLKTTFKTYRDAVVKAKLEMKQAIYDASNVERPAYTHGIDQL